MKYGDLIEVLEASGWSFSRMGKGDHMVYRHPTRNGSIVAAGAGKLNRDVPKGTQQSILKQAGLR
jgi:predicted RNA binding protein YcfA (HicA-like mRNA interferase family)